MQVSYNKSMALVKEVETGVHVVVFSANDPAPHKHTHTHTVLRIVHLNFVNDSSFLGLCLVQFTGCPGASKGGSESSQLWRCMEDSVVYL